MLRSLPRDRLTNPTATFLDIPQGVAYALIAGLPPAMGLYAAPAVCSPVRQPQRLLTVLPCVGWRT